MVNIPIANIGVSKSCSVEGERFSLNYVSATLNQIESQIWLAQQIDPAPLSNLISQTVYDFQNSAIDLIMN